MLLTVILVGFAALSLVLTLWQWLVAWRYPLHRRMAGHPPWPPLTLLKPLKGCDAGSAECLRSWLRQRYASPIQILFGVASSEDPVCAVVRQLITEHPKANAQLVICQEKLGPNAKVSTLIQLERMARYDTLVISDADVHGPADLLEQLVTPLRDSTVGLVNCFYRLTGTRNFPMRWEAFAVNADFWSQVLQSQTLKPIDFAMGAVMATTRNQLERIGGFAALVDYLADDYHLGNKIARNGARIALCPVVVECRSSPMRWRDVWAHQLRWARTIRVCQPVPYFFSLLSNATLWPLLLVALASQSRIAWSLAVACLLARMATGFYCERKLTGQANLSSLWMGPVKDILQVPIWALAFLGNRITWRGQRFQVRSDGKLVKA